MIKNKPFADLLKGFETELQQEEKILSEMRKVVETQKPFYNGEFVSREKFKDQKNKVQLLKEKELLINLKTTKKMSAENTTPKKNFYSIREKKFRFFVPEKTETSKSTQNEDKTKTYHYEEFNRVSGYLRKMMKWTEESKSDASKTWEMFAIDLRDDKMNLECLQMYFNDNAATSFLKRLPNIDLTKEVFINLRTDDKDHNRIDVYQKNENDELLLVPYFWTKENPLPKWEEIKGKGKNAKTVWDRSEQDELLEKLFNLKNAEIVDTIAAIQKDGVQPEELKKMYADCEFGKVLNYVPMVSEETAIQKHRREVAELDAANKA